MKRNNKRTLTLILIAIISYWLIQHMTRKKELVIPWPVVAVQHPDWREMVDYITQTGTTVAYNSINLVARVEGYLDAIKFIDGTVVKKNTELLVIQPEPYWEQLKAAQATVAAHQANYDYSKLEYARQQRMYQQQATSLNNVEKWLARKEAAQAELDKAKADEANAAINYGYTHISAPFDGRIGRHLVDEGNLVGNGAATILATIEQIDTLYVYFNLNELDLIKLRAVAKANSFKPTDINQIPVYVNLQNESGFAHKATLDFVNTGLNASTGTMELRAVLDNKNYLFVPGLFVQVQVAISKPQRQLTVPSSAVLYDQIGAYLLLVDTNNKVVLKHVQLGSVQQNQQAITRGLNPEDRVIIEGLQNATPGNPVTIRTPTSEKKPNDF